MKKKSNEKSNNKNLIKKLCVFGILIYVAYIFINQQATLNSYKTSQKYYKEQLDTKLAYQKSLEETQSNINSEEYIEKIAREKLDMYLPNERVYMNKNN